MTDRRRSLRAALAFTLALGVAVGVRSTTPGALAEGPAPRSSVAPLPALSALSLRVEPGQQELSVRWSESSSHARYTKLHLTLLQVSGGQSVAIGGTTIGHTVEPSTYYIPIPAGRWNVRATPENNAGFGPSRAATAVTVGNPCTTADVCTSVSPLSTPTPIRMVAQGFLLSLTDWSGNLRNSADVKALAPRQWRFSGPTSDPAAKSLGVSRTQILSDLWNSWTAPNNGGYALTPWSDWNRWDTFVRNTVRQAEQQGWAPNYWDVWNEPNGTCCPRFSPADQDTITVARWLQTYMVAWRAIKAVDPNARAIGPSLSALQWAPGAPAEFDLDTFLAKSAQQHVVWDGISWHENTTAPSPGDLAPSIRNVDRHVAMAKAVMARHPGTVVRQRIFINEYGPSTVHVLPGWTIGYFRAFEDSGVVQANRACWGEQECTSDLGGLVTPAGNTTSVWWAHRAYLRMADQDRMQVSSTSPWQVDGIASREDGLRTVRVLLGRHWSCDRDENPWCTDTVDVGPASVSVSIAWPYGTAPVSVTAYRLAAGVGPVDEMPVIRTAVVRPSSGRVTMTIPAVGDGDGVSIVAKPG